jgi:hypothetical protein
MRRLSTALLFAACCFTASAQIASFSPPNVAAGSSTFNLTINGQFPFSSGAPSVSFNSAILSVVSFSATQVVATVPASLIAFPGTAIVNVQQANFSASANYVVLAPVPVISSLNPTSVIAGSPAFQLLVNGSNFIMPDCGQPCPSISIVNWNGIPLTTLYISATQLSAAVPANLVLSPVTVPITVVNPDGGASSPASFTVTYPVPTIAGISPSSAVAGSAAFTLTVSGTGFFRASTVQWNGTSLTTSLLATNAGIFLTAAVPASLVATAGTAGVTVLNPGVPASNIARFTIVGQPTLISISPNSATAGDPSLTLTALGTFFQTGSTVLFNGQALPTAFVSAGQLTASLSGSLLAPGTASISIATPGQLNTGSLPFNIGLASLILTSLSPSTVVEGGPALTLTVSGSGFISQTTVLWNNQPLATTFISASQLTAIVPAALVAKAATVAVTASNPNQAISNGISFVITPTPIAITSLSPATATAGGAAFTITVTGTGFLPGVGAIWNGSTLSSNYVSATQLTAVVPAALIANIVPVSIRAANPNGPQSNALPFTIGAPTLTLTSLAPNAAAAGGPAFTLTATGTGFQSGSQVLWNGSALSTAFVSATQLTALIPAGLTASAGTASVTVSNPGASVLVSNALPFTITAPVLSLTSISPNSATAGSAALTLTASGTAFTNASVVQWNGSSLATAFISATQLTASIPANLLANNGTASVTVSNGATQTSNALAFTINLRPVTLTVASLSPATATAGSGGFTLTVNGTGFTADAGVLWNSTPLATAVVGAGQVTAVVPASLVALPGAASIAVTAGGVTSNAATFTIALPPAPTVTLTGPTSIGPAQQPPITFNLGNPYPLPLAGTVTLTFTSNAVVPGDDPSIQFASGGRTLTFTVPANSLTLPSLLVQTGTVAGAVTLTLKLTTGTVDVTPPGSTLILQIPRQAPLIRTVTLVRNTNGIEVDVSGYATSREVTQATFHFNVAAGSNLQVADFTVPLTSTFAAWYGSTAAAPFGSQFTYAQPFTVQGSSTAIASVTVTLSNSIGASQPVISN